MPAAHGQETSDDPSKPHPDRRRRDRRLLVLPVTGSTSWCWNAPWRWAKSAPAFNSVPTPSTRSTAGHRRRGQRHGDLCGHATSDGRDDGRTDLRVQPGRVVPHSIRQPLRRRAPRRHAWRFPACLPGESAYRHPHRVLNGRWNRSCKYDDPSAPDTRIIHFHGRKHCRPGLPYHGARWVSEFEALYRDNVADLRQWAPAGDRMLERHMRALDRKAISPLQTGTRIERNAIDRRNFG